MAIFPMRFSLLALALLSAGPAWSQPAAAVAQFSRGNGQPVPCPRSDGAGSQDVKNGTYSSTGSLPARNA